MDYKPYLMKDVYAAEKKNLFKVISLFAGMGGSSTGYRLAGGNVIAANEFMESARKIYSKNYPHTLVIPEDIRKLTGKKILNQVGLKKGELDVLDGSPPCASFSNQVLKTREKSWGKKKIYSKTVQRVDDLFFEFARILNEIQPKVFIAENVRGLTMGNAKKILGSKSKSLTAFGKLKKDLSETQTITEALRSCGYKVSFKLLNSLDFGVPEKRVRLIFIGVRNDIDFRPSFPKSINTKPIHAKDVIGHLLFNGSQFWMRPDTVVCKTMKKYFPALTDREAIMKISRGQNIKELYESIYDRTNWFNTHFTICQSNRPIHALVDRWESIEEAKAIQSFPEDFDLLQENVETRMLSINELEGLTGLANHEAGFNCCDVDKVLKLSKLNVSRDDKFFRLDFKTSNKRADAIGHAQSWEYIGRAVPPLMMKAIAKHVYENILKAV